MVIRLRDYLTKDLTQLKGLGLLEDLDPIAQRDRKIIITKVTKVLKTFYPKSPQTEETDIQILPYEPSLLEEEFRLATEQVIDLREKLKVPNVKILLEDDPAAPEEVVTAINKGNVVAMTFHGVYGYIASGFELIDKQNPIVTASDLGEMRLRLLKERSRVLSAWGYFSIISKIIDLKRVPKKLRKYIQDENWLVRHCAQDGQETFIRFPVIKDAALAIGMTSSVIGGDNTLHYINFENAGHIGKIQDAICGDDHQKIAIISSANKTTQRSLTAADDVLREIEEEDQRMVSLLVKALPENEGPTTEELKKQGKFESLKGIIQPVNQIQIQEHIQKRVRSAEELVTLVTSGRVEGSKPIWSFIKDDPAVSQI
jgi:hypothetical protein